jgi:hypothetical protein
LPDRSKERWIFKGLRLGPHAEASREGERGSPADAKTAEPGLIASREGVEAQFVITLDRMFRGLETGDMDSDGCENARLMIQRLDAVCEIQGLDRGPEAGGDR